MTKIMNEDFYSANNYIRVIWEDTLDNYSKTKEKEIERYFINKYKTNRVRVVFSAISNNTGTVNLEGVADASEIVLDDNYQKLLIEKYIKENKVKTPIDHILKLDHSVNMDLEDYKENTQRYKTFKIKELHFDNFLSFGDGNSIILDDTSGVVSFISDPPNFGGKSVATVDLLLFLFFGLTTKSDKMEDIFNKYRDCNRVSVSGKVEIEGEDYIINRVINRKETKDGFTHKSELDFYQILPDGGKKLLNGEQRKFTDNLIKTYVGSVDDFLITILTTGDNLEDLIKTKPTERGRILTKFIGLEFFREKERIAKKKYAEWKEKSKMHHYNAQTILGNINSEQNNIDGANKFIGEQNASRHELEMQISGFESELETLFKRRFNDVDAELYQISEEDTINAINGLKTRLTDKKSEIDSVTQNIPEPKNQYDIDRFGILTGRLKEFTENEVTLRLQIDTIIKHIADLRDSEICQLCKRALDGVDHTAHIAESVAKKENMILSHKAAKLEILNIQTELDEINKLKKDWDEYNKNQLIVEKLKLELTTLEASLKRGEDKLTKYRESKNKVIKNQEIDTDIQKLKIKIKNITEQKDTVSLQIRSFEKDIEQSNKKIEEYKQLLKELSNEEKIDDIFRVYLDIYGKNGISKMVLGTMIPLINSQLKILLSDSCNFDLEMRLNAKNEVEFIMIDLETNIEKSLSSGSGFEKTVSSLALRCVLSKVCSLPKPNIILFDEISGKVSNENLDMIAVFFEKLKTFFEHIWIISHNPLIQDWADHVIKVVKVNNVSKIEKKS